MMEFVTEIDGQRYDISELVREVTYADKLNDGCSKLEFSYIEDELKIQNGSSVAFKYDGTDIFYGYVFKHSRNSKGEVSVTAYDQLRYCKAKDSIIIKNNTITDLIKKMCLYFELKTGKLSDTSYILATSAQDDKTWLDIIYDGIKDTLANKGEWYSLRDEFGKISLRNLTDLKLDLVLGDESLCYDYSFEKSIEDSFYNQIKLVSDNESSGKRDLYIVKDENSIDKFGMLQYFEVLDKNLNTSQAKSKADMLLQIYNREVESLSLECLGDTRVRAGSSFYGRIEDAELDKRLIVQSVTHKFLPVHTMSLEVFI